MAVQFEIKTVLATTPENVYTAWLNSESHSLMTEAEAEIYPEVGKEFTTWDDYISGKNIELIPGQKIIQKWRTVEFKDSDQDSHLEINLKEVPDGCEITILHTDIPDGQPDYEQGWKDAYFRPMKKYFAELQDNISL